MGAITEIELRESLRFLSSKQLHSFEQIGNSEKPVYRLNFSDQSIAKLRFVSSPMRASELSQLVSFFTEGDISKIYSVYQNAMFEEWIDGEDLSQSSAKGADVVEAGKILGRLHRASKLENTQNVESVIWRIEQNLNLLTAKSFFNETDSEEIKTFAQRFAPLTTDFGITHRDMCGENLIRKKDGKIVLIDHESMRFGPLDQDLARTCHRWELTCDALVDFLNGYSQYRNIEAFKQSFYFWIVLVLTTALSWGLNSGKSKQRVLNSDRDLLMQLIIRHADYLDPFTCWDESLGKRAL